jgi:predicted nucleic acid-binding protein
MNKRITHLLDTSVYSQPIKKFPLQTVIDRWYALGDDRLCTSLFCETEVLQGLEMKHSDTLWHAYRTILKDRLPLLPFDRCVAKAYAALQAEFMRKGKTRPIFDLFIASTARVHNLHVATCNYRDFQDIPGLSVEDWSE